MNHSPGTFPAKTCPVSGGVVSDAMVGQLASEIRSRQTRYTETEQYFHPGCEATVGHYDVAHCSLTEGGRSTQGNWRAKRLQTLFHQATKL